MDTHSESKTAADAWSSWDSRAVSDTLAFVLTFAIIITSVGLVYGVGFTSLNDIKDGQQSLNAQQTFGELGENINDIRDGGPKARSKQIELRGGTLTIDTTSQIIIEVNGSTVYDRPLGTLKYSVDQTNTLGYEGGASFGKYQESSVMESKPGISCGAGSEANTTIISLVVLEADSSSVGSSGTVEITAVEKNETLIYPNQVASNPDVDNVSVTITDSPFQEAWEREFDGGNTFTCNTERVFVRVTIIGIEFET